MKKLAGVLMVLLSAASFADNSCNVDVKGGMKITQADIEFSQEGKAQYRIVNDQELWVKNRQVSLSQAQQESVNQYSTHIRKMVPEVRAITLEGVDIASSALDMVFQEFLGQESSLSKKVKGEFDGLRMDLDQHFLTGPIIYFNHDTNSPDNIFAKKFENRIESIAKNSTLELSWSIIKMVTSAMANGTTKEFEAKMDKFGKDLDVQMKARADVIDKRAKLLCDSMLALDAEEETIKAAVAEIAKTNMLVVQEPHTTLVQK